MFYIEKTIGDVNMAIKEIDQRTSIFSLEKRFIGKPALCAPHRQLMAEHEVEKWCVNLNRWKGYTPFLFNDLLIYARKKFRGYKLHQKIPIDEFCTVILLIYYVHAIFFVMTNTATLTIYS